MRADSLPACEPRREAPGRAYERRVWLPVAAILLLGLAIRLPVVPVDSRVSNDMAAFRRWAGAARTGGLAGVYTNAHANYPPLSLYLLAGAAAVESRLPAAVRADDRAINTLIKLPAVIADVLTAGLIVLALRGALPAVRVLAAAAYVFNPGVWYVSAYWGQTDALYTMFLVASVVLLGRAAVVPAWLAFTLALATKVQSLALAPLLLVATVARHGLRGLVYGLLAASSAGLVLLAPWLLAGNLADVFRAAMTLPDRQPLIVVTAYNVWYLLRLGRVHQAPAGLHPAGVPFSYYQLAVATWLGFVVVVAVLAWRRRGAVLAVPAALLCLGQFMLLPHVRERYLLPALPFLLLAAAWHSASPLLQPRQPGRGLVLAYGLVSATFFYNLVTIASFAPATWINLIAPQPDTWLLRLLRAAALLAAATNTAVLVWLTARFALHDTGPEPPV